MNDRLETVAGENRVKLAVGSCRFIASVARTDSEQDARAFIARVSAEFQDATHNAFAYKIGSGDSALYRSSDAGEPAGTAGKPMLLAVEKAGITNVTVVGTRFFGGVKLGIGGLIRAYRTCADAGLADAKRDVITAMDGICITVTYDLLGHVMKEVAAAGGVADSVDYHEDRVTVVSRVPASLAEMTGKKIADATKGKAEVIIGYNNR